MPASPYSTWLRYSGVLQWCLFLALVFVIDSSCPSRFVEAQCELMKIFAEKELADTCFLVILNRKQQFYSSRYQCEIDSAAIDQLVMNINRFGAGKS